MLGYLSCHQHDDIYVYRQQRLGQLPADAQANPITHAAANPGADAAADPITNAAANPGADAAADPVTNAAEPGAVACIIGRVP